jgi:hypothetical protein
VAGPRQSEDRAVFTKTLAALTLAIGKPDVEQVSEWPR